MGTEMAFASIDPTQISVYRRTYDGQYGVDVYMYDPTIEDADFKRLRENAGNIPDYFCKRWVTVGVFRNLEHARDCAMDWRKRTSHSYPGTMTGRTQTRVPNYANKPRSHSGRKHS